MVFGEIRNIQTGIQYLENPSIDDERSVVEPRSINAENYTFIIKHTLHISNPNAAWKKSRERDLPCEFHIVLPMFGKEVRIIHKIGPGFTQFSLKSVDFYKLNDVNDFLSKNSSSKTIHFGKYNEILQIDPVELLSVILRQMNNKNTQNS